MSALLINLAVTILLSQGTAGLERDALKAAAIAEGVKAIRDEFAPHVRRVNGTDDKLAGIIAGEFGKLPAPVAPIVATK